VHEEPSGKRGMKDRLEGGNGAVGKGEISTLLMVAPGLMAVGTLSVDVAILVALEALFDVGARALMEVSTEVVLNVVNSVLEAILNVLVVALFRAHAGVSFWKGAAEFAMFITVLKVGVGADLV
jgi:hypothetical protein